MKPSFLPNESNNYYLLRRLIHHVKTSIITVSACFLTFSCNEHSGSLSPVKLRCEYLENPIGIDTENPRFSWQMAVSKPGVSQKAFQLFMGTDSSEVALCKGDTWESGKVKENRMPVVYRGQQLKPFTRYYWGVKIQDENGAWSGMSPLAFFETGMMGQNNWKGNWISDTWDFTLKPAPYFRKSFEIKKKVASARVYIAVAGLYELSFNGQKTGDHRLDPMFTRFDRRTYYVTYDVTGDMQNGENVIGVLLGNGWYNHQSTAVWYFDKAPWRARPKFCMDLRVRYEDGSEEVIVSGSDWKTSLSPVIFNSIYTAEHYDPRLEQPGWDKPGFDDSKWKPVLLTGAPSQNIVAQAVHPIRNVLEIKAVDMIRQGPRTFLFDFGRNMAGVTKIKISGKEGTIVRLKHVEILDKNGRADMSNIDVHYRPTDDSDPFQTDILILSGKGEDVFMPRFNYKGFQYVEVTADKPISLTQESLTAYFMHSDVPVRGEINASNELINKLWKASNASYLSNFFGYPTDCPQREKNGWNGDSHINIETGLYNYDGITVYEKWMEDFRDEQQSNGVIPAIVPTSGWGYHWANGPDWTSTIAIIPWNIYLFYGDSRLLETCYDNIRLYVDHIDEISPSGLTDWGLGDWIPVKSVTTKDYTSSAYYYVNAVILSKAAGILGMQKDQEKYTALAEKIKNAFNDKYLNRETGIYADGNQTQLSFALHWGLVPEHLISKVAENLAKRVIADNSHIDVGLQGSKTILNALSQNGYPDLAYKLATRETFPSWGWWIVNGATTFFENWLIGASKDLSMNHIGFGEINAWFYKALGGIFPDEMNPGFKNVILKPNFVEGLDQFMAKHEGPYGTILSSWEKTGNKVKYNVSVPPNSTATLYLGAEIVSEGDKNVSENKNIKIEKAGEQSFMYYLKAGNYHFLLDTDTIP